MPDCRAVSHGWSYRAFAKGAPPGWRWLSSLERGHHFLNFAYNNMWELPLEAGADLYPQEPLGARVWLSIFNVAAMLNFLLVFSNS